MVVTLLVASLAACSGGAGGGDRSSSTVPNGGTGHSTAETKPIIRLLSIVEPGAGELLRPTEPALDPPVTADTRVTMNGQTAELADLRTGDRAIARGTARYENGELIAASMHFDSIEAYQLVVGPVDSVDVSRGRLVVLGQRVIATSGTAVESATGDVSVLNGGLAKVEPGSTVAISGFLTASGEIVASRISLHTSNDGVLLRGFITAVDTNKSTFGVGTVSVGYGQAALEDFPAGHPAIGDQVLIRADFALGNTPLQPRTVRFLPPTLQGPANAGVFLEGLITRYVSAADFDVNGVGVRMDCSDCRNPEALPRLNGRLWLEGALDAKGIVRIQNWNGYGDPVLFSAAPITAIDTDTGVITLYGRFQMQPSPITRFRDGLGPIAVDELHSGDLRVGDVVDVFGDYGGFPGLLLATEIYRYPESWGHVDFSISLANERFELVDPAIIALGRPIVTKSTTPIDRCEQPSDTVSLFSSHPDSVSIELPVLPSDPLEATRITFVVWETPSCPSQG
jgi:hypothetical protein